MHFLFTAVLHNWGKDAFFNSNPVVPHRFDFAGIVVCGMRKFEIGGDGVAK